MSISESMKEYYGMQVEEDMKMPIDLTLHDIKHIIEWYHTHTRTAGTTDCEDAIAERLGEVIGDQSNKGFRVI